MKGNVVLWLEGCAGFALSALAFLVVGLIGAALLEPSAIAAALIFCVAFSVAGLVNAVVNQL